MMRMNIVVDTSALIAVILGEPERDRIIELTVGCTLIGPGAIPWEVGNAFSAMLKRNRLTLEACQKALESFALIPIRVFSTPLSRVLELVDRTGMYAYDVYFLECSLRHNAPLLTLDRSLQRAGKVLGIDVLEV